MYQALLKALGNKSNKILYPMELTLLCKLCTKISFCSRLPLILLKPRLDRWHFLQKVFPGSPV